jgi:hypothetical protein
MKSLRAIVHEITGLFIDDGWLAVGVLTVVVAAVISELLMADTRMAGGAILLFGCLGVLFMNVVRASREQDVQGI